MIRRSRLAKGLSKGQIAVIMTLCLPVLIGIIGFGADFGVLYFNWVQLQKAADAAALAGASQLTGDTTTTTNSSVVSTGTQYAHLNGVTQSADTILVSPANDDKSVSVYVSRQVPYYFLEVLGLKKGKVTAKATAGILPTQGVCGAAPFGLPCKQSCNGKGCYGQGKSPGQGDATCGGAYTFNASNLSAGAQVQLKSNQNVTGVPGNWEPLAIGGNGASVYRSNIAHGEAQIINVGERARHGAGKHRRPDRPGLQ